MKKTKLLWILLISNLVISVLALGIGIFLLFMLPRIEPMNSYEYEQKLKSWFVNESNLREDWVREQLKEYRVYTDKELDKVYEAVNN